MEKRVVELFAGVGGFRVGLNRIKQINETGTAIENGEWKFVWSNQYEPSTKSQDAFNCYNTRFPSIHNSNQDISLVNKASIPDHSLLTGGFPCQDYSVARSLSHEKGIEGKKGVLWWQIKEILETKNTPFVLLENVDRLLISPSKQRGRDFGIMLKCLDKLGYVVEWRVINASDYGHCQRRRRTYIFAYKNTTRYYNLTKSINLETLLETEGVFAKTFPIQEHKIRLNEIDLNKIDDLVEFSQKFEAKFESCGIMRDGVVITFKSIPLCIKPTPLLKIIEKGNIDKTYFLDDTKIEKFKYLRGSKKIPRIDANGHEYFYSEGAMSPFDDLSLPGRTMLTSEGSINRSTHLIKDVQTGKLRILTPVECERLNEFPDNWTNTGMSSKKRYFMMGNALVCGIIETIGNYIEKIIEEEI